MQRQKWFFSLRFPNDFEDFFFPRAAFSTDTVLERAPGGVVGFQPRSLIDAYHVDSRESFPKEAVATWKKEKAE